MSIRHQPLYTMTPDIPLLQNRKRLCSNVLNDVYSHRRCNHASISGFVFRLIIAFVGLCLGASLWYRTTNLWMLKNLGDSFIHKAPIRREIVVGAFHRPREELNVRGSYAVIQFISDVRLPHDLYCISQNDNGKQIKSRALIERIHKGKRGTNDVCAYSGFLAECEIAGENVHEVQLSTVSNPTGSELITVPIEKPVIQKPKHKLVVCVAPMYIYTDWQIMVTGIETWLALGATKIIFPIQSVSSQTMKILQQYVDQDHVILRHWPKWPVFSDLNPNGLVLSRGIEESHVNCLHFAKPFAEMVAFTDIDDMLIPPNPLTVRAGINIDILQDLFNEHPQAGSFLFEHKDVQFVLPSRKEAANTLKSFDFSFLQKTKWKQNCNVWRMKTRVVVNASRVDTVNMHETGIHRLGYVQVRVPCRKAHFYHLRHSYKDIASDQWRLDMSQLSSMLSLQWKHRLEETFPTTSEDLLTETNVESFEDFDKCVMAITEEHFRLSVSRCMTPHACYVRMAQNVSCTASSSDYGFARSGEDFIIAQTSNEFVESQQNCDAPVPVFTSGSHFYLP